MIVSEASQLISKVALENINFYVLYILMNHIYTI